MQGKVFSTSWSPDDALTLAAAGSKAKLQVWDIGANAGARKVLGPKLAELGRELVPSAERRRDIVQTIQFVVDRRSGVEAKSKVDEIAPH